MRTPVMAGNWKMYKTASDTRAFFEKFNPLVSGVSGREIVICPPFVNLQAAVEATQGTRIEIGAQNCYLQNKEGAFTGEVTGTMIAATGAKWVIIGHSERRQYFGETDETVLTRTVAALEAGLKPIVCVGERLEEREGGRTETVLARQFANGIAKLTVEQFLRIVVAYEPVWAIGTGKTATPEIAEAAHKFLRGQAEAAYGKQVAAALRILYGGSVKPDNTKTLMAQEDIDGTLVGGASLEPESFAKIVGF